MIIWIIHFLLQVMYDTQIAEMEKGLCMFLSGLEMLVEAVLIVVVIGVWIDCYLHNRKQRRK